MVIDDGGHLMKLQKPSFEVLWDHVMPGGVYFIEDLDVVPAGVVLNPLPLTLYPLNQLSLNTYPLNTHSRTHPLTHPTFSTHIGEDREVINRDIMGWMDMLASTNYPSHPDWHESKRSNYTRWPWRDMPSNMIGVHVQKIIAVFRKSYTFNATTTAAVLLNKNKASAVITTATAAVAPAAVSTPLYVWDGTSNDKNQTQEHNQLRRIISNTSNNSSSSNSSISSNNISSNNSSISINNISSSTYKPAVLPTSSPSSSSSSSSSWWQWATSSTSPKSPLRKEDRNYFDINYWQIIDRCKLLYQEKTMKPSYATLYCEIMRDFHTSPSSSTSSSTSSSSPASTSSTSFSTSSPSLSASGSQPPRKLRLLLIGSSSGNISLASYLWASFFSGLQSTFYSDVSSYPIYITIIKP